MHNGTMRVSEHVEMNVKLPDDTEGSMVHEATRINHFFDMNRKYGMICVTVSEMPFEPVFPV